MFDSAAFALLNTLASLQRRHSGAVILLAANRTSAWPDSQPEVRVSVDPALLRVLQEEGLVMMEPYAENKPRGTQILGMTSRGWSAAEEVTGRVAVHAA